MNEEIQEDSLNNTRNKNGTKKTLVRLGKYILKSRFRFIFIVLSNIISTSLTLLAPFILGLAITDLFEALVLSQSTGTPFVMTFDLLGNKILILLAIYLVSAIFKYIEQYLMAELSQRVTFDMRKDVNSKLNKLPLKYFDKNKKGEILSRATNDIEIISTTLTDFFSQFIASIVSVIGAIIMMIVISPALTLIAIILLPIIMLFTSFISKKSRKYFSNNQKNLGELNAHIEEMYTGQLVIKAFSQEEKAINTFEESNDKLYKSTLMSQFLSSIISPVIRFINRIGYVIIAIIGGIFVTQGRMSIGSIQAFINYSSSFGEPIAEASYIIGMLQSTIASSEKVFKFLDEEEQVKETSTPKPIKMSNEKVEFNNVKFGYSDDNIIMDNINISLNSGDKIAIVGPTGAGKTTLVNLLMRFYEVQSGSITIDGIPITDMSRRDLRSMFGMVLQDTWLFNGTIYDNIAYSKPDATYDEVIEAAKSAHIDHFIRTLPDGYNTIINEESSNISQGQKQLLTIARVILKNPYILILDEATSSIDTRTEIEIQKAMSKLMENRTSFVIAHRLSTIKDANLILVMKDGNIIEMGNHTDLLERGGFYEKLYKSQFDKTDLSYVV